MKNGNKDINVNESNSIELIRAIYKEIIETKEAVNKKNAEKIDNLGNKVAEMNEEIKKIDDFGNTVEGIKEEIKKIDDLSDTVEEMKEEIKKIDDLSDTVEEMKEEIKKIDDLSDTVEEIKEEIKKIDDLGNTVNEMQKDIKEIKGTLNKHTEKLEEHDKRFDNLEKKTDNIEKKLDNLDKIERLHFEYTRNKFARLDKKIDTNFSCLENKIENEAEERKVDISRIEGKNDFDRIVLSDFGSRISILEEEGEKYNIN